MLSSENPPPDLPYSSTEISLLKISDVNNQNQHQLDDDTDLFKSGLVDNNIYPLPNFSIRDYVYSTRSKDIKNNWPFSQKNLQLCLKYGVNEVLPPFQSPESVRNPSAPKSASENLSYPDGKLSACQKLAVDIENSTRIKSVHSLESPRLTVKASKKVETNIRNTVKKCRLIARPKKNIAEQKSSQDLVFDTETMASNVCPVCKTFSSSSNTTLNAHIDQCLSGESNIKCRENSKRITKHKIKPRKARSMVEIYETALHCTLEDLDRRNGTKWASNFGSQADPGSDPCAVEKNEPCSSANLKGGDVYVDSSGIKLRSLSKLGDVPSGSNASYDCGPGKGVKKYKASKFLSSKKKKCLAPKEKLLDHCLYREGSDSPEPDRVLKRSPYAQKSCDFGPDRCPQPEVKNRQPNKPKVCDDVTQSHIAHDQTKPDDLGMIRQWVGSKRTGIRGKMNLEHEGDHHPDKYKKNPRIKSCMSYIDDDMLVKRNSASKSHISCDENPLSPTESFKRKKNLLCSEECRPRSRKRRGISSLQAHDFRDRNNRPGENEAQTRRRITPLKKMLGENETREEKRDSSKSSINRTTVVKLQTKRETFTNAGKSDVCLTGVETSPRYDNHESVCKKIDSFAGGDVEMQDEFVRRPCYGTAGGEAFVAFSKSLDSIYRGRNVGFLSQHYGELDMFCPDEVISRNSHDVADNYYVDPIPIPGPPGSFLPSPGRMGSEELPGNSSLTTCKIQSSEDERDFFGLDSSHSPISAMSVVSNSFASRSESPSVVNIHMPSGVRQKFPEKKPTTYSEQNASNSPIRYSPALVSYNSEATLAARHGYRESPSPSASTPVFRLMGKNLLVVNKDGNWPSQTKSNTPSGMTIENHLGPSVSVLENLQASMPAQHFDCGLYDFRPLQMSAHPSVVTLPSKSGTSNEYASKQIVTEDSSEISEASLAMRATHAGANPIYGYHQTPDYPLCAGSPIFQNGNYTGVPFPEVTNPNLGDRYCTGIGSSVVNPNSLTASSLPYVTQHRSSLYCSPRFS